MNFRFRKKVKIFKCEKFTNHHVQKVTFKPQGGFIFMENRGNVYICCLFHNFLKNNMTEFLFVDQRRI